MRAGRPALAAVVPLLLLACDPVTGSGPGKVPDAGRFLVVDAPSHSAVLTLIGGYPATDFQFNYNGYVNGELKVTLPVGWTLDVQCENRGTVPNSCAVVGQGGGSEPIRADWSTPQPAVGLRPGESASFEFVPEAPGQYRIASLVPGRQAAGMWMRLEVAASGQPSIRGASATT